MSDTDRKNIAGHVKLHSERSAEDYEAVDLNTLRQIFL